MKTLTLLSLVTVLALAGCAQMRDGTEKICVTVGGWGAQAGACLFPRPFPSTNAPAAK